MSEKVPGLTENPGERSEAVLQHFEAGREGSEAVWEVQMLPNKDFHSPQQLSLVR